MSDTVIHLLGGQKLYECDSCGGWFKYEPAHERCEGCHNRTQLTCDLANIRQQLLKEHTAHLNVCAEVLRCAWERDCDGLRGQLQNSEDTLQVIREERDDLQVRCEEALTDARMVHEALVQAREDCTTWRNRFDRANLNNHILQGQLCAVRDALK